MRVCVSECIGVTKKSDLCVVNQIAYNNAKKNENIIIDGELGVDGEIERKQNLNDQ